MIPLDKLIELIAQALTIPVDLVQSNSRLGHIVDARSLVIHFAKLNEHNDTDIIQALGLIYSKSLITNHLKRLADLVQTDRAMQGSYEHCSQVIKNHKLDPYANA